MATNQAKYQETVGPADVITPDNSVVLRVDHQVGLMNIIRDRTAEEVKTNVLGQKNKI